MRGQKATINLAPSLLSLSFNPSCLVLGIGLDLPVGLPLGLPLKMACERDVLCWEELGCTGKDLR